MILTPLILMLKKKKESGEKMTAEEKFELKNEQLDNRIAMKEEFKKILTAEQMEKLELNNERRQEKMQQKKEQRLRPSKGWLPVRM